MSKPYAAFAVAHDTQKQPYMYPSNPPPTPLSHLSPKVPESDSLEHPRRMPESLFEKTYAYPSKSLHSNISEWLAPKSVLATELGLDEDVTAAGSNTAPSTMPSDTHIPQFDYNESIRCPRFVKADVIVSEGTNNSDSQWSFSSSGGDSLVTPSVQKTSSHTSSSQTNQTYTPAKVDLTPPRRVSICDNDDEASLLLEQYTHNNCIYQKPQRKPIQLGTPAVLRPIRSMPSLPTVSLDELDYSAIVDLEYKGAPTKRHWIPNSTTSNCMKCYHQFATIPLIGQGCSRHHCRVCGGLYCSRCIATGSNVTIDRQARFVYNVTGVSSASKVCHRCVGVYRRLQTEVKNRNLTTPINVTNPFIQRSNCIVFNDGDDLRLPVEQKPSKRLSIVPDDGIVWSSF